MEVCHATGPAMPVAKPHSKRCKLRPGDRSVCDQTNEADKYIYEHSNVVPSRGQPVLPLAVQSLFHISQVLEAGE